MEEVQRINTFFGEQHQDACLETAFVQCNHLGNSIVAEGEIILERKGELYPFRVQLPRNFPLGGMRFYYQGKINARHLLRDGLVCLDSFFTDSFDQKLRADFEAILEWIDKYLLEPTNTHYEYLPIVAAPYYLIFEEKSGRELPPIGASGEFILTPVPGQRSNFGVQDHSFFADSLAGHQASWSQHYKEQNSMAAITWLEKLVLNGALGGRFSWEQYIAVSNFKQTKALPKDFEGLKLSEPEQATMKILERHPKGLYVFLETEPINSEGEIFKTFRELWNFLPASSKAFLNDKFGNEELLWSVLGHIPLALGYKIPNKEEIHWEWVLLQRFEEVDDFWSQTLIWGRTVNAAHERFFGRGVLHPSIAEAKVLVLGCGAIGSSLSETLTRGGLKQITVADPEAVEAGNVCRSIYSFTDIHSAKVNALANSLIMISPFIWVQTLLAGLAPVFRHHRDFDENKALLKQYDIIFDCTANNGVAWMLDQMKLDATVINLSITDEAKQLVAVTNTGKESILPIKQGIFDSLGEVGTNATFYEGAGCWHPTFQASFADINLLLQQYIAGANHRLEIGKDWTTIVLETIKGDFGVKVKKREDC